MTVPHCGRAYNDSGQCQRTVGSRAVQGKRRCNRGRPTMSAPGTLGRLCGRFRSIRCRESALTMCTPGTRGPLLPYQQHGRTPRALRREHPTAAWECQDQRRQTTRLLAGPASPTIPLPRRGRSGGEQGNARWPPARPPVVRGRRLSCPKALAEARSQQRPRRF
jgi:hypothetical protein